MPDTDRTVCKSCGVPWEDHLGIQGTCRKLMVLREALRDIRDNWDCDADAHKYRTGCRRCNAQKALEETE